MFIIEEKTYTFANGVEKEYYSLNSEIVIPDGYELFNASIISSSNQCLISFTGRNFNYVTAYNAYSLAAATNITATAKIIYIKQL